MKALIYNKKSDKKIQLIEKDIPQITEEKDAIVKVTMSSICTSDLHIIDGYVPKAKDGIVLGHEYVGEVVEIGSQVKNIKIGDRVSANCETFCGECYFCQRGYINNCENGGWVLGHIEDGCQAEYIRVHYADNVLSKLPDNVTDKNALLVGDVLATGYFGAEMCEIKNDDTIAIIGSGPVGMCGMICARIMGAKTIIAIDIDDKRLEIAKEQNLANIYLNPKSCDVEKEIKNLTQQRGADGVIEAAGTSSSFELAWKIARPNAIVGVVALYEENQTLPLPKMYGKNLTFKTGGIDAIHSDKIIELISQGKINTDFLITHTYKLDEIEKAYEHFRNKTKNCIKIAITN